jgi:hypothetical protein
MGRATLERNFYVNIGSATWNLGSNWAFALGRRKSKENLDRLRRSQNFPDANRLSTSYQSFKNNESFLL